MFHSPVPNADRSRLEHCSPDQLIGFFASFLQKGPHPVPYSDLPDAWGALFTEKYLSADDLVTGMQDGTERLAIRDEQVLHDFIRADCAAGGPFVLSVVKTGGNIDRAALIMIAAPSDLASVVQGGTTALHMLATACDWRVRPALIARAGPALLSGVYDSKGMPVLFTIFGLPDLCREDLAAIAKVFTESDLMLVLNRNRTGKNGLEIFDEAFARLKTHLPGERNKFFVSRAIRTTNPEGDVRNQLSSSSHPSGSSGTAIHGGEQRQAEEQGSSGQSMSDKYEAMMTDPLADLTKLAGRKTARR